MRISDWSSDVCSSDLAALSGRAAHRRLAREGLHQPRLAAWRGTRRPCLLPGEQRIRDRCRADRAAAEGLFRRSEERRVGKSVSVRVDLGGRRIIKKKKNYISLPTRAVNNATNR